jgi:hypothetical protein
MEKLFWLLDETSQVHFVMAAEITGTRPVPAWRAALRAVQERHPLLSVFIHPNGYVHPAFHRGADAEIPLRVVEAGPEYRWEQELENELATPFDAGQAPLVRTVLVQQGPKNVFILASHHSIGDGLSGLLFLRDLLQALSGQALLPPETPAAADHWLGIAPAGPAGEPVARAGTSQEPSLFTRRAEARPVVERWAFSPALTSRLVHRSRAEGTTVHGALSAALVLAGRAAAGGWGQQPVRVVSPASFRQALGADEALAQYIVERTVAYPPEPAGGFWELARFGKRELVGVASLDNVTRKVQAVGEWVFGDQDPREIADALQGAVGREIMVSNLGRFPYSTDFGSLQLAGVWGPLALSGYPGDQTVGVTTTNGVLRLAHVSRVPLPGLLPAAEAILAAACAEPGDPAAGKIVEALPLPSPAVGV